MGHLCLLLAIFTITLMPPVFAAGEDLSPTHIARVDQNPVSRFYTLRFEDNAQFGFGPDNETLNFFRIQALVPFKLNEDWHLVTRVIVPIAHLPWPESTNGLSDVGVNFFLTPGRTEKFIWAAGPAFLFPTATDEMLGTEKWSAGLGVAAVYISGPWVVGAVAQNLWSFAGDDQRQEINVMAIRPLVNYNLPNGWYLSSSPSIEANWKADGDNRWLVPLGGGFGKIFTIGNQRISALVESYYHVLSPEIGPDWQMRFQISLLYPD